jgi:hypothetical protein
LAALVASPRDVVAATVDISMNVFPTNLAQPNNGGTWRIVAKTDAPLGIAAINTYLKEVDFASLAFESDIGQIPGGPYKADLGGGAINAFYGQDIASGPIITGVGRPEKSDGPDPLGNPGWDGATRIFSGAYNGAVPMFTTAGFNQTDANVLVFTTPGSPAQDADVTTVVRVQVPEPAAATASALAALGLLVSRRRGLSRRF